MSDYSQSFSGGANGTDPPRLHPDAVRSWRNDMSASINAFLSELRSLEHALEPHTQTTQASAATTQFRAPETTPPVATPPETNDGTFSQPNPTTQTIPMPPAPPPTPPPSTPVPTSTGNETEFDTRLANLKKMIAEKLTHAESVRK